ncbi:MAG: hypothetical protein SGPRY_014690, partial [Prymnesium sp.]
VWFQNRRQRERKLRYQDGESFESEDPLSSRGVSFDSNFTVRTATLSSDSLDDAHDMRGHGGLPLAPLPLAPMPRGRQARSPGHIDFNDGRGASHAQGQGVQMQPAGGGKQNLLRAAMPMLSAGRSLSFDESRIMLPPAVRSMQPRPPPLPAERKRDFTAVSEPEHQSFPDFKKVCDEQHEAEGNGSRGHSWNRIISSLVPTLEANQLSEPRAQPSQIAPWPHAPPHPAWKPHAPTGPSSSTLWSDPCKASTLGQTARLCGGPVQVTATPHFCPSCCLPLLSQPILCPLSSLLSSLALRLHCLRVHDTGNLCSCLLSSSHHEQLCLPWRSSQAIIDLPAPHRVLSVSDGWTQLHGYAKNEIVGCPLTNLLVLPPRPTRPSLTGAPSDSERCRVAGLGQ